MAVYALEMMGKSNSSTLDADELFFLQEHLQQTAGNTPQAQAILHKFDRNLSMIPLADALPQLHTSRLLQLIRVGIETGSCLHIRGYNSLSSDSISDRKVEPLEITDDSQYLIAWDIDKNRQSQFKLVQHFGISTCLTSLLPLAAWLLRWTSLA
jgi:proteasome accessory factor C